MRTNFFDSNCVPSENRDWTQRGDRVEFTFWIGLALAIPFSVAANLLTPTCQRLFQKFSKTSVLRRTRRLQDEFDLACRYKDNPTSFHEYLLVTVIKTTAIVSLVGLISGLFSLLGFVAQEIAPRHQIFAFSVSQFVQIVGALIVVQICTRSLRVLYRVRNFVEFESFVRNELGGLGSEAVPIANGRLVKGTGPKVFIVENGKRRWIPNEETFHKMGHDFSAVLRVSDVTLEAIPVGENLPSL